MLQTVGELTSLSPGDAVHSSNPIGVFDSGVGGLSVLRAIRNALPHEDLFYVADTLHLPYGEKSAEYIQGRSLAIARFLVAHRAKALVIACNTATSAAAPLVRATFDLPVIAMEPAVKPAASNSKAAVVGVLATAGTLASDNYAALVARFGQGVRVLAQECPGLVTQVESGKLDDPVTRSLIERYTAPLLAAGADILVLGCTHYPFLRPLIAQVVGPHVQLIDSGDAVARRVESVLMERRLLSPATRDGCERFWTSGDPHAVQPMIERLWGASVVVEKLVERGGQSCSEATDSLCQSPALKTSNSG